MFISHFHQSCNVLKDHCSFLHVRQLMVVYAQREEFLQSSREMFFPVIFKGSVKTDLCQALQESLYTASVTSINTHTHTHTHTHTKGDLSTVRNT